MDEHVDRAITTALTGVGVNLDDRPREAHFIVTRLVAAQTRSHNDEEIGGVIELLRLRRHIVGAKRTRMDFRHDGAAIGARHRTKAAFDEFGGRHACSPRAAAEQNDGPMRRLHKPRKLIQLRHVGAHHCARRLRKHGGKGNLVTLHVDWNFEAHRTGRR